MKPLKELNGITGDIVDAAVRIHRRIGPGLLKSVYESILARDLARKGYQVERQKGVSFAFDGYFFENAYRVDLLVEGAVIVEVKSVGEVAPIHKKQIPTHLRLLDCRLGILLNFGAPYMKDGIVRIAN